MSKFTIREEWEKIEGQILSPFAQRSFRSKGRLRPEPPDEIRTEYQRDRDRIIHSKAFRRLKHKTQVLFAPQGDHYRTRMTHTLEVSQIARTIGRALGLNEDLIEAIALGHDLGHTPFGHAGEQALDNVYRKYVPEGFRHYEQSLRVVDVLENEGKGLNLTFEVRDGILHHSKGRKDISEEGDLPATLEGQVVRISDRIAYINHDLDDALRAGLLCLKDVPKSILRVLGETHSRRIGTIVKDVVERSKGQSRISISPNIQQVMDQTKEFLYETVYLRDEHQEEWGKVERMITLLFDYFVERGLPGKPGDRETPLPQRARDACDYVAGMTDQFALWTFHEIFEPRPWQF